MKNTKLNTHNAIRPKGVPSAVEGRNTKRIAIILFVTLILLLLPQAKVLAATYYVDAANGNDNNPGTINEPWRTIQKAASVMSAGDTCKVLPGIYAGSDGQLWTAASGNAGAPIVYQAEGNVVLSNVTAFTIKGNYNHIIGFEFVGRGPVVDGNWCKIEDNYIHDTSSSYGLTCTGSNCIIRGNTVIRGYRFAMKIGGENNLVEYNDVSHTLRVAASGASVIYYFGKGHTFRRNYVHDQSLAENGGRQGTDYPHMDAFVTWGPTSNVMIEQNIVKSADEDLQGCFQLALMSERIGDVSNITFRNNIFISRTPGYIPISLYGGPGDVWDYGLIENITVVNNTFVNTTQMDPEEYTHAGIWVRGINHLTIKNNIFYNYCNAYFNINYVEFYPEVASIDVNIGYNCVYNSNGLYPSDGPYPNDLWMTNPDFVDFANSDFHLQPDSPCIDKGETLSTVTNDYDGNPRPQGAGYDIGAYEYISSTIFYGDVSGDGEISAFDAALTAHIAVELPHPDIKNRAAAEVSGDGEVSAYDAALIAQRAVGLISSFPIEQ